MLLNSFSNRRRIFRLGGGALLVSVVAVSGVITAGLPAEAATTPANGFAQPWIVRTTAQIATSSPVAVSGLSGGVAVAAGDRAGKITIVSANSGQIVSGWSQKATGAKAIEAALSSPSTAHVSAAMTTAKGGTPTLGTWSVPAAAPSWLTSACGFPAGCDSYSGISWVANAKLGLVGGNTQYINGINAANGQTSWHFLSSDTTNSTPASTNLTGSGELGVFTDDQTPNPLTGAISGGHLRLFDTVGRQYCNVNFGGGPTLPGSFDSSPAVGPAKSGVPVIVFGTGASGSNPNTLFAYNADCQQLWSRKLIGPTVAAPAISVVNGRSVVFELAPSGGVGGTEYLYEFDLSTGYPITAFQVRNTANAVCTGFAQGTNNSVATYYSGTDLQVVIPTGAQGGCGGGEVYSTTRKAIIADLATSCADQNTPLVTQDTASTVGISIACYAGVAGGGSAGFIYHYTTPGTIAAGTWPEFQHDPALTGSTAASFSARDSLVQGQMLTATGSPVTSESGDYTLQVTAAGQLTLTKNGAQVWVLGPKSPGAYLLVAGGNLRLVATNGKTTWQSPLSASGAWALSPAALSQAPATRGPTGLTLLNSGVIAQTITAGTTWSGQTVMWSKAP